MRCRHIDEIIQCFECIKFRTTHYSDTVTSAIKENQLNSDISTEFITLCNSGTEPDIAWKEAVRKTRMFLSSNEKKLVTESFNDISSSSIETLEEKCNKYINEFSHIKKKHTADKDKKIKLSTVAIMSFGLIIILIFI